MTRHQYRLLWWNVNAPGADRMRRQLAAVRHDLGSLPDVLAFGEVLSSSLEVLREELEDYSVIAPAVELAAAKRRCVVAVRGVAEALPVSRRFTIPERHHVEPARGFRVWPRSIVSVGAELGGQPVEIVAAHIPNGSSNGWVKIDHLWALRYGVEESELPQIVCCDLNTPQAERDGEIITFGQEPDGSLPSVEKTDPPYTPERPWQSGLWDEGERAVLEGLPRELDMADAFRELNATEPGYTWGPRGEADRRLDHVFVSRQLGLRSCVHVERWRNEGLSDHWAVHATLEPALDS
jgi:endonuclease/exonuclease/phosphatase family metal-dependent hydrolase